MKQEIGCLKVKPFQVENDWNDLKLNGCNFCIKYL